jgi:Fe-S-cluster containining protein
MADYPFIIIEFPEFDVAVPLICRLCGKCCRKYYVPVDLESLPEIAEIMGESIHSIQARLNESLESCRQGNPRDCCFLAESRCLIHEVKPEACRQFPSFTDAAAGNADCPAHKEHKRIERALCRENDEIQIRLPSCIKKARRVPDSEWQKILGIVEKADISELFLQAFVMLNKAEDKR